MTSYSLSNILLPAVFVSSAVFSSLTIPFALIKSEPVTVEIPPLFSGEIQPIFNGEHKDVAIPYIGFAIVASVGAGIATVEVNRRWQAYRESLLIESATESENTEAKETISLAEYRPEVSEINLPIKEDIIWNQESDLAVSLTSSTATEAIESVVDTAQLAKSYSISNSNIFESLNFSSVKLESSSELLDAHDQDSVITAQKPTPNFDKILNSRQEYQTCRIKVPHVKPSLLAIIFEQEYYSFLRAEKTQNQVIETINKINHNFEKTVITHTAKGYVIWKFEPESEEV